MDRRYTRDQLKRVLGLSGATSWQETLDYLAARQDGDADLMLDREAVLEMREDVDRLQREGAPFEPDAPTVYARIATQQAVRRSE